MPFQAHQVVLIELGLILTDASMLFRDSDGCLLLDFSQNRWADMKLALSTRFPQSLVIHKNISI